jgi:hypothetical protein
MYHRPNTRPELVLTLLAVVGACSVDVGKLRAPSRLDSGHASDVAWPSGDAPVRDDGHSITALDAKTEAHPNFDGTTASAQDARGGGGESGGGSASETGATGGMPDATDRGGAGPSPADALPTSSSEVGDSASAPDIPVVSEDADVRDAWIRSDLPADAPRPDDGHADGGVETASRDSAAWIDGPAQGLGGSTGSGGAVSSGGETGSGGAIGSGGTTGTGGVTGSGGTASTGGGGTGGCGRNPSTLSSTTSFAAGLGSLIPNYNSISAARLAFVTTGPASNSGLCSPTAGCAALSVPYSAGTSAFAGWVTAYLLFSPRANLLGATVTLDIAVDNPGGQVPIQIMAFATGDASASYSQALPTTVAGANLSAYAPTSGFNAISLVVEDHTGMPGVFCASNTAFIGLEVQNTSAITSANAGTVTAYIRSITVTPPP